jgi:hypothetical protein
MDDGPPELTPAERALDRALIDDTGVGKPLPRRAMQRERSVESYLRGEFMPRYMQRAAQIEQLTAKHASTLREAFAELRDEYAGDAAGLEQAWAAHVDRWDPDEVNVLIEQHNDWYPMERDLPMDPRTGDYVLIQGHSYRRDPLDRDWALRTGKQPPR